ncbi:MAG: hypothetical protein LUE99_17570 [Bacteroides sp.]|nr:hypothetical protein [Bacteroides sp.]
MNKEEIEQAKHYYQILEENITELSVEEQGKPYRPCAIDCVKDFVYKELKRQFDECEGDLDLQYTKYGRSEYFFADIIEKGRVYEMGYPRCLCPTVISGFTKAPVHCECSRQSILYVLQKLLPDKEIEVETIETVLSGSEKCRFRVTVQ